MALRHPEIDGTLFSLAQLPHMDQPSQRLPEKRGIELCPAKTKSMNTAISRMTRDATLYMRYARVSAFYYPFTYATFTSIIMQLNSPQTP